MNLATRNLRWHWRMHLAVLLGVAAAGAALAGALLVGDSMRGSLRAAALDRLGHATHALLPGRFFRAALADELCNPPPAAESVSAASGPCAARAAPLILLTGGITHAGSQARVEHVQVLGVDQRFWSLSPSPAAAAMVVPDAADSRTVRLNGALAAELHAAIGDDIILRIGQPAAISTETLLGRRDDTTRTIRLTVAEIVPDTGIGAFSPSPRQQPPFNAFVPLETLQRLLEQPQRANALLLTAAAPPGATPDDVLIQSQISLKLCLRLADYGLSLRTDEAHGYVALQSDRMLLEPHVEIGAGTAAADGAARTTQMFAYLANEIRIARPIAAPPSSAPATSAPRGRPVPYSTVVGVGGDEWPPLRLLDGRTAPPPAAGELLLNQWAATELAAEIGDRITLEYFVTAPPGGLATRTAEFTLVGIVELRDAAADPGFVPDYPGVTDAKSMSDWDPPFPVDFRRVLHDDERYWDDHHATPKVFVNLAESQRLWAEDAQRLGRLTAIRFQPRQRSPLNTFATELDAILRLRLDPPRLGFSLIPLRDQALAAAAGNTDFGGLFIGFSFFLIAAAAMLVVLLFRLGVERRAREIGLLSAVGFPRRQLTRLLLVEGAGVAIGGTLLGLLLAPGYAALMLSGLRSWWSDAVNAPFLRLHIAPGTLEMAAAIGVALALSSIAWAARTILRASPRTLLAGGGADDRFRRPSRWPIAVFVTCLSLAGAAALIAAGSTEALPPPAAFFGSGALCLIAALALLRHYLRPRTISAEIHTPGPAAWLRLGLRNAGRNPGRALLTTGLIACASFLITALGAFRLEPDADPHDRHSGAGGYTLYAEAAVPLPYDLNTPAGRDALGLAAPTAATWQGVQFLPFRLRPGDASSCLNLYSSTRRRILGATERFIARGGFAFSASHAENPAERENPWLCLNHRFDDGAIPVIGDEAAVKWQLHSGLGRELTIEDAASQPVTLRFVALLAGSALQDELIVADADFQRLFPRTDGYAFFLIDTPPNGPRAADVEAALERDLAPYAFDAASTVSRIAAYNRVQNTYLATFQTLGGFGLILGVIGLAAVLLRNVWERRGELALLAAVGFSRTAIGAIVLSENAALLMAGLLAGVLPALVAIAPQLAARPAAVPWLSLAATLGGVVVVGLLSGVIALVPALRTPPLRALRAE